MHHGGIRRLAAVLLLTAACGSAGWASVLKSEADPGADRKASSAARLLAGLSPSDPGHRALARTDAWKEHSAAMQAGWSQLQAGRVAAIGAWRDEFIRSRCPVGKTLLYPFSGPDFFNAFWLFPDCETFVLFGLEHIGELPDVEAMNERDFARLLGGVRAATADLFERNYFITQNMTRQLHTSQLRGVVPLIAISMALSGLELVATLPQELPARVPHAQPGTVEHAPKMISLRRPRGIAIDFRAPGRPLARRLLYFSVDATDGSLARYPEFVAFLRKLGPTTTLLKSASYMLHSRHFRQLRNALLDASEFLVQDDSGLPYRMLVSRGWQVRLHGTYARPIPPFAGAFQPMLLAAYQAQHPEPLPFAFGYSFNDHRDERANLMVASRPAGTRASAAPARDTLKYSRAR